MEETKVIYYIDDEETPYMMKIPLSPTQVTLSDFKGQLNRPFKKFFFKSMDDDIGVVKEEIIKDDASLPVAKGRIVCWVVSEGSNSGSEIGNRTDLESLKGNDDTSSIMSGVSRHSTTSSSSRHHRRHHRKHHKHSSHSSRSSVGSRSVLDSSTDLTNPTDLENASNYDTEDTASRLSVETTSTITSLKQPRRKVYTKKKVPRSMSMSTMTTSSMSDASMQILTVTLDMDAYNFLGISIVGHANDDGVGGIYVGTVMKGGAVAADSRIEPGDMLLQVNSVSFENMNNDDAVRTLREIVQQPGPITLTVAKCYDTEEYPPIFEPRMEPIMPLDPSAWVMHTNMQRNEYGGGRPFTGSPTLSTMTSNSSPSLVSSIPESERDLVKLTLQSPMYRVAKAMAAKDSGLEVKDRVWLKMTIPKSFIGSELVDWLFSNVEGFIDRRHSRKYAALLLKQGFIQHTVNKITFSEQCYYVFGNFQEAAANKLSTEFSQMHLSDNSGGDTDTLGPLPNMGNGPGWSSSDDQLSLPPYDGIHMQHHPQHQQQYMNYSSPYSQSPENKQHSDSSGGSSASGTSRQTVKEGNGSKKGGRSQGSNYKYPSMKHSSSISSASEFTSVSQQQYHPAQYGGAADRMSVQSLRMAGNGMQQQLPRDMSGSRASFQNALDNPCEYFIDVM